MKPGIINTAKMNDEEIKPIIKWLEANGIDPNKLPRDQKIICTGATITYDRIKQRQHRRGGKAIMFSGDTVARERVTKLIRHPFKDSL